VYDGGGGRSDGGGVDRRRKRIEKTPEKEGQNRSS